MKNKRGITLIALVITIIVLLVLAGVTLSLVLGNKGILNKATNAKTETDKATIKQKLEMESVALEKERKDKLKTDKEILEELKENADFEDATYLVKSKYMLITTREGYDFTVLYDGTVLEGKLALLDIADGSIKLKRNGYIQGNDLLVEHYGEYIITGTTLENTVSVMEDGIYNITIKDLYIDVRDKSSETSPINANAGSKASGCFVNLNLEGNNALFSNGLAGIHFCGGNANTIVETNRSTLTINGNGYLDTECKNGYCGAGIGGNYSGVPVCDIIINSGNIKAVGRNNACGIGGGLRQNAGNIIINGGNIIAIAGNRCGIGADGKVEYIEINGGNITANGGEYGTGIGGSGKIKINGGNIIATRTYDRNAIGGDEIIITGGTIKSIGNRGQGIYCKESVTISGGNVMTRGKNYKITTTVDSSIVEYIPKNEENNLYETQIKLQGVEANKQITKLMTSDNINYGVKDMYTLEDGMIYLYLPKTEIEGRTITLEVDRNTYSGIVETKETAEITTLTVSS